MLLNWPFIRVLHQTTINSSHRATSQRRGWMLLQSVVGLAWRRISNFALHLVLQKNSNSMLQSLLLLLLRFYSLALCIWMHLMDRPCLLPLSLLLLLIPFHIQVQPPCIIAVSEIVSNSIDRLVQCIFSLRINSRSSSNLHSSSSSSSRVQEDLSWRSSVGEWMDELFDHFIFPPSLPSFHSDGSSEKKEDHTGNRSIDYITIIA